MFFNLSYFKFPQVAKALEVVAKNSALLKAEKEKPKVEEKSSSKQPVKNETKTSAVSGVNQSLLDRVSHQSMHCKVLNSQHRLKPGSFFLQLATYFYVSTLQWIIHIGWNVLNFRKTFPLKTASWRQNLYRILRNKNMAHHSLIPIYKNLSILKTSFFTQFLQAMFKYSPLCLYRMYNNGHLISWPNCP